MENENVIRDEAKEFYDWKMRGSGNSDVIDDIRQVKYRLDDFYSSESKAIFLDEIQQRVGAELNEHRSDAHGGKAERNCPEEKRSEKMLFYLQQELEQLPTVAHQKFKEQSDSKRKGVFVSYSHEDLEFLTDIRKHFKPFEKIIDFWDDSKIKPGDKWKREIGNAIEKAKVAILLVSADFFGSEFIQTKEIPPLLEKAEKQGAVILTVILKPCLFEAFEEINQFQAMNPPSHPVSKMDVNEREDLYVNLLRQTKKILETD